MERERLKRQKVQVDGTIVDCIEYCQMHTIKRRGQTYNSTLDVNMVLNRRELITQQYR